MSPRCKLALGIVALAGALCAAGALLVQRRGGVAALPRASDPALPAPQGAARGPSLASAPPAARTAADVLVVEDGLAAVQGRALDARTREPLPWFELDVVSAGTPSERVRADAAGRFASVGAFALTDLTLAHAERAPALETPFDERWKRFASPAGGTFVESRRPGEPLEVLAEVGPTFHLRLRQAAIGPTPFVVRLRTAPSQRVVEGWSVVTLLRHEDGTWARFAPIDTRVASNGPWRLSVESVDGLWFGEARVDTLASPQSLAIDLEPLAFLTVSVLGPEERSEPRVELQLLHLDADGRERQRWEWDSTGEDGHRLELLPRGDYLLRAESLRHVATERRLRLVGGEDASVELRIARRPEGGSIAGELRSATDGFVRHAPIAVVQLRSVGESRVVESATPTWQRVGEVWACTFRFEDLPAGEYEVSMKSLEGAFPWEPAHARVFAPAQGLLFVRRDDSPTEDLELEVLDARGDHASGLLFSYTIEGSEQQSMLGSSPLAIRRVALGVDVDWAVTCAGHRPLRGGRAAFTAVDGGRSMARRQLRPGWGARIHVRTDEPGRAGPLSGVLVTIDGEPAGTTDAAGDLDVERDSEPRRLQAALPGWTQVMSSNQRASALPPSRLTLLLRPERRL